MCPIAHYNHQVLNPRSIECEGRVITIQPLRCPPPQMINHLTEQRIHTLSFERPIDDIAETSHLITGMAKMMVKRYGENVFQCIINQYCVCSQERNQLDSDIFALLALKEIHYGQESRLNSC